MGNFLKDFGRSIGIVSAPRTGYDARAAAYYASGQAQVAAENFLPPPSLLTSPYPVSSGTDAQGRPVDAFGVPIGPPPGTHYDPARGLYVYDATGAPVVPQPASAFGAGTGLASTPTYTTLNFNTAPRDQFLSVGQTGRTGLSPLIDFDSSQLSETERAEVKSILAEISRAESEGSAALRRGDTSTAATFSAYRERQLEALQGYRERAQLAAQAALVDARHGGDALRTSNLVSDAEVDRFNALIPESGAVTRVASRPSEENAQLNEIRATAAAQQRETEQRAREILDANKAELEAKQTNTLKIVAVVGVGVVALVLFLTTAKKGRR